MLPVLGLGAAAALLAMALLGQAGCRNPAAYIVGCAAAGALMPPVGAAMRARWAIIAGGGLDTERAYSLDAATEETLFTAGLALAGLAVSRAGTTAPLLAGAAVLACAALAVLRRRSVFDAAAPPPQRQPLLAPPTDEQR
jgi:hypothetical protein